MPRYRVSCEWTNPQTELRQFFTSEELATDPADRLGEEIDVLIDPRDDERCWVDTSSLESVEA